MSIVRIAQKDGAGLNSPVSTGGADTTGANLIGVFKTWSLGGGSSVEPALSDSKGNTYTNLTARDTGTGGLVVRIAYVVAPTVGSAHTWTLSGASTVAMSLIANVYSGAAASPFDQESGTANGSTITSLQPGALTASEASCLYLTGLAEFATGAVSIDSGFGTPFGLITDGATYYTTYVSDIVQGAAAALNPTWSWSGNLGNQNAAAMAIFKAAAGAASRVVRMAGLWGGFAGLHGGFA